MSIQSLKNQLLLCFQFMGDLIVPRSATCRRWTSSPSKFGPKSQEVGLKSRKLGLNLRKTAPKLSGSGLGNVRRNVDGEKTQNKDKNRHHIKDKRIGDKGNVSNNRATYTLSKVEEKAIHIRPQYIYVYILLFSWSCYIYWIWTLLLWVETFWMWQKCSFKWPLTLVLRPNHDKHAM